MGKFLEATYWPSCIVHDKLAVIARLASREYTHHLAGVHKLVALDLVQVARICRARVPCGYCG